MHHSHLRGGTIFERGDVTICTRMLQGDTESIEVIGEDKGWEGGSPRGNRVASDLRTRACDC